MDDLITNGKAKTDLDRIESTLSYVIGQLVEHYVKKAVEAKLEAVVLVTDQLKGEVDEIKADLDNMFQLSSDTVNDIVTERLDERDAERNDAEDASEYLRVEDLPDAVRDCFLNGDVTLNVEVS